MDEILQSKRRFEAYIKDLPNAKDWYREFRFLFLSITVDGGTAYIGKGYKIKAMVDEIITGDSTNFLMETFYFNDIELFKLMITRREAFLNIDLDRVFAKIINKKDAIECEVLMKKILEEEIQRLLAL